MSISDLSPQNTIEGGTDSTTIGNEGDRLKVDANISGISVTPAWDSTYRIESSRSNQSLTSVGDGTLIFSNTGSGYLESFWAELDDEKFDFVLFIDGVKVADVDMEVFEDAAIGSDRTIVARMPIVYERDQKQMLFSPTQPIRYSTSFEIRLRDNSSTDLLGYAVTYTED